MITIAVLLDLETQEEVVADEMVLVQVVVEEQVIHLPLVHLKEIQAVREVMIAALQEREAEAAVQVSLDQLSHLLHLEMVVLGEMVLTYQIIL